MKFIQQLPQSWQAYWQELHYEDPSLIQRELYEKLSQGENILGISPTGSGKTVAYLLPLLQRVEKGGGNQLLILLPSQELAVQVTAVAREWGSRLDLNVQGLIGGANVRRQVEKLKEKPEVLVGTPGRVHELIKNRKLKAHLLRMIVLDEVDQLIETSELNATQHILKTVSFETQLVCVSATALAIEEGLGKTWSEGLTTIDVTESDQSAGTVIHSWLAVEPRKRLETLRRLAHVPGFKGVIFFNELTEMGAVAEKLAYQGVANATLASDQNKLERRLALSGFEADKFNLLLTTDLAARGLDFTALPYVVHYDVPYNEEAYLHRSGRTGRMGNDGHVLTLASPHDMRDLRQVTRSLNQSLIEVAVYGGKILPITEMPVNSNGTEAVPNKTESKKVKVEKAEPKVKVKKKKIKQNKNKGARRKK